jgi:hypothetical protein
MRVMRAAGVRSASSWLHLECTILASSQVINRSASWQQRSSRFRRDDKQDRCEDKRDKKEDRRNDKRDNR